MAEPDRDRARFQYASIMRQTSPGPNHEEDKVIGFNGKYPEVHLAKEFDGDSVVGVRYERLELIEFEQRMSDEDIHEYFVEEDPLQRWCDEDGFFQPHDGATPDIEKTQQEDEINV